MDIEPVLVYVICVSRAEILKMLTGGDYSISHQRSETCESQWLNALLYGGSVARYEWPENKFQADSRDGQRDQVGLQRYIHSGKFLMLTLI